MDYKKLFHKEEAFQRETFQKRMEEFGFKNMARMELFLWDLELFLHIQKILTPVFMSFHLMVAILLLLPAARSCLLLLCSNLHLICIRLSLLIHLFFGVLILLMLALVMFEVWTLFYIIPAM